MKNLPMISIVSLPLSVVVNVSQFLYQDWEFAVWISVAVIIDTILSVWKHLLHKDASSEAFWSKFSKKIIIYILLLILSNILANFKVNGSVVGATHWIGTYICVFMMVRECFSCVENIQAIYPIFPTSFVRRLKDFNDKGEYIKND
ncbi:bacteriophage holin [Prevotella histicola]|jgi:phage-related holin|uniref:bacteriophage holin n=1 Tax=Prevotella histicola TaxID=470565 RepID=UPI002059A659|nr:MAG TPA: holin [Caudoviricetes sp.]DAN26668.1 MAG TPA: holin [Caudoviricetes sp.]DAS40364.1 MAG TPA: holin [Caudoviricetes sp.]